MERCVADVGEANPVAARDVRKTAERRAPGQRKPTTGWTVCERRSDMGVLDLPRGAALPRLRSVTDREIIDKVRRFERALAAWETEARSFRRTTTALQAASDELLRVANLTGRDARGLEPDEAEERAMICSAISALDRHLAPFG